MSDDFFATPLKAERAILSAYKADELRGRYGIRIELEPLEFSDPDEPRELEAEIILDHLALPSIVPAELQDTRFVPNLNEPPPFRYEGSCYFMAEHNWVDLEEIRFFDATENGVTAEYHLTIDLPTPTPRRHRFVLAAFTEIETGHQAFRTLHIDGLGTLVENR